MTAAATCGPAGGAARRRRVPKAARAVIDTPTGPATGTVKTIRAPPGIRGTGKEAGDVTAAAACGPAGGTARRRRVPKAARTVTDTPTGPATGTVETIRASPGGMAGAMATAFGISTAAVPTTAARAPATTIGTPAAAAAAPSTAAEAPTATTEASAAAAVAPATTAGVQADTTGRRHAPAPATMIATRSVAVTSTVAVAAVELATIEERGAVVATAPAPARAHPAGGTNARGRAVPAANCVVRPRPRPRS